MYSGSEGTAAEEREAIENAPAIDASEKAAGPDGADLDNGPIGGFLRPAASRLAASFAVDSLHSRWFQRRRYIFGWIIRYLIQSDSLR